MSMLDRYRKPGGFQTLLSLVETCNPTKQEKFLELIRTEDPRWADALKVKMLNIARIYSWTDETLSEVVGKLQDLTLATAMAAAPPELKTRLFLFLSASRRRKIDDLLERSKPSAGEVITTHMKIVETVRKMAAEGALRFEKFDATLQMDDKFEENLLRGQGLPATTSAPQMTASEFLIEYESDGNEGHGEPDESVFHQEESHHFHDDDEDSGQATEIVDRTAEVIALQKRLISFAKENAALKHELATAKAKLEQIKKIA